MINFDEQAKTWDTNPDNIERAQNIGEEISKHLENTKDMSAIEYGCGTALLGLGLLPDFKSMTLSDASGGMLKIVDKKIAEERYSNCKTLYLSEEKIVDSSTKYDCIVNAMLLHHIEDTKRTIKEWSNNLNSGGYLCIADLMPEDGSFHKMEFHGHLGFDPEELAVIFEENGITVESITIPHTEKRKGSEYPVFLIVGRKK